MDRAQLFEKNIAILSLKNPSLGAELKKIKEGSGMYSFQESRTGEMVPGWKEAGLSGASFHSLMNPQREAQRLMETLEGEGFLILLGLGGGYHAEAALARGFGLVLVLEYHLGGLYELLQYIDYTHLFTDPRFFLMGDLSGEELEELILHMYKPALYGGIKVLPLGPRVARDTALFQAAGEAINSAINRVSSDYSVQAHFGIRWFSNIIRNLAAESFWQDQPTQEVPPIGDAAICAAGPSLVMQIPRLAVKREKLFCIATDTSLPCLLSQGIVPDAVISMDCQHISYYHFLEAGPIEIPLFLDLASPPLLSSHNKNHVYYSGGHPLTQYLSQKMEGLKGILNLDTSGANVTYAALSLAESLGAQSIELYGADFSYPLGVSYARGTYIYSYFAKLQHRLMPLEAQASAFLYRTPLEKLEQPKGSWYYQTGGLNMYRRMLEEKAAQMEAQVLPLEGMGAPISIRPQGLARAGQAAKGSRGFSNTSSSAPGKALRLYRDKVAALPPVGDPGSSPAAYLAALDVEEADVFTTLLPLAGALRKRRTLESFREAAEAAKDFCITEIDKLLP
ncbi:MAG: DUF115 domain-containing protein [Treponema sp.]|nr:DUF115 domain-containing protein [Treponema sp.]